MNEIELLERVGIGEKESKIYLSLIKSGPVTVAKLAQNTGLHRPTVYKHLPELRKVGLVSKSKKGKLSYYVAEPPTKLEQILEDTQDELRTAIPEFMDFFDHQTHKPNMKVFEGKAGMKHVLSDILNTMKRGEVFYRYSSRSEPSRDVYLPKDYKKKRDAKGLQRFVIASEAYEKTKKPSLNRQIRVVPGNVDLFKQNVSLIIYADRVAILDFTADLAYIIENPAFASFQRTIFKLLYSKL